MAITFPTSPTTGQAYTVGDLTWTYDGAKWKGQSVTATNLAGGDAGTLPYQSAANTTAQLAAGTSGYILKSTGAGAPVWGNDLDAKMPYTAFNAAGKNKIINGGFDFWQRGASSGSLGAYTTADRWHITGGGTVTAAQETSVVSTGFKYALRLTTGASSSFGEAYQPIENLTVVSMLGQTVTLSAYVRVNNTYAGTPVIELQGNTSADTMGGGSWATIQYQNATASTSGYVRVSMTVTLATNLYGLRVRLGNSVSQASGAIVYWDGVQLEAGSVATPFSRAGGTLQGELAACQQYYEKSYNVDVAPATSTVAGLTESFGSSDASGFQAITIDFKVAKRGTPTISIWGSGGTANTWGYSRNGASSTATVSVDRQSNRGFRAFFSVGSAWVVCNGGGHWVADNEL